VNKAERILINLKFTEVIGEIDAIMLKAKAKETFGAGKLNEAIENFDKIIKKL